MLTLMTTTLMAAVLPIFGQIPKEPARDLSLHSVKAPGLEVRFVDYHWQPALMKAMETGSQEIPEARRNWVLARVMIDDRSLVLEGVRLAVGTYALALWPNLDGKGMAIEVRKVDLRDVYPNMNVMAPMPRGETVYKAPARFEALSPLAPRLDITATDEDGAAVVTVSYGDKRFSVRFRR